jgi:hypothetical protein
MGKARGMAYRSLLEEDEADFRDPLAILLSEDVHPGVDRGGDTEGQPRGDGFTPPR